MAFAPGTVSLLRMENDILDETGNYVFDQPAGAPVYDNVIFAEGVASIDQTGSAGHYLRVLATIAEGIKTVEMYFRGPALPAASRYCYSDTGGNAIIKVYHGAIKFRIGTAAVWSGTWVYIVDTWYHLTYLIDGGDGSSYLYVDNIQRLNVAATAIIANDQHRIGAYFNGGSGYQGRMDYTRLSDITQPGPYPTQDTPDGGFMQPGKRVW